MGFDENSFIPCENCTAPSADVHHIVPRSKFGIKTIVDRDKPTNLIALCRNCHTLAHREILTKERLFDIVSKRK